MKPEVKLSTQSLALVALVSACASVPPQRPALPPLAPVEPRPSPVILTASSSPATKGNADLDKARALLAQARNELTPQQWELLDRKLTEAERAWQRFEALLNPSEKAARGSSSAEGLAAGLAETEAMTGLGATPVLVALALLWPSSVAGSDVDTRPPWLSAKIEYEAKLKELSEAAQQVRSEIEVSKNLPALPTEEKERPECKPVPVPHRGNDSIHDMCADVFPPNRFPGHDVLVNGKRFDALQLNAQALWEIKTDRFDTYAPFVQERVIKRQMEELRRERNIAEACGYEFVVGVSRAAHEEAIRAIDDTIKIKVTGC